MLRECNISSMQQIWRYSNQHLTDTHLELKCTCYVCITGGSTQMLGARVIYLVVAHYLGISFHKSHGRGRVN